MGQNRPCTRGTEHQKVTAITITSVCRYKETIPPYKEKELRFPGVKIESVTVDKLTTYFDYFDSMLNNGVSIRSEKDAQNKLIKSPTVPTEPQTVHLSHHREQQPTHKVDSPYTFGTENRCSRAGTCFREDNYMNFMTVDQWTVDRTYTFVQFIFTILNAAFSREKVTVRIRIFSAERWGEILATIVWCLNTKQQELSNQFKQTFSGNTISIEKSYQKKKHYFSNHYDFYFSENWISTISKEAATNLYTSYRTKYPATSSTRRFWTAWRVLRPCASLQTRTVSPKDLSCPRAKGWVYSTGFSSWFRRSTRSGPR